MSYAIFRGEGIKTILELSQRGSHNERTKDKYKSNPNIRIEDSKNNIEIIKTFLFKKDFNLSVELDDNKLNELIDEYEELIK